MRKSLKKNGGGKERSERQIPFFPLSCFFFDSLTLSPLFFAVVLLLRCLTWCHCLLNDALVVD